MATVTPSRPGPPFRLTARGTAIFLALLGLVIVYATDQIVPASTDRQAELRFWLAARATGIVAFLLLTLQIVLGLVLSHPTNRSTWNLSKRIFPWHDHLWVFVLAFLVVHIVSLVVGLEVGREPRRRARPRPVRVPLVAGGHRHDRDVRLPHHGDQRSLDHAAASRGLAVHPPARPADLGDGLDARRPRRDRYRHDPADVHRLRAARRSAPAPTATGRAARSDRRSPRPDRRYLHHDHHLDTAPASRHDRGRHRRPAPRCRVDPRRGRLDGGLRADVGGSGLRGADPGAPDRRADPLGGPRRHSCSRSRTRPPS